MLFECAADSPEVPCRQCSWYVCVHVHDIVKDHHYVRYCGRHQMCGCCQHGIGCKGCSQCRWLRVLLLVCPTWCAEPHGPAPLRAPPCYQPNLAQAAWRPILVLLNACWHLFAWHVSWDLIMFHAASAKHFQIGRCNVVHTTGSCSELGSFWCRASFMGLLCMALSRQHAGWLNQTQKQQRTYTQKHFGALRDGAR